MKNWLFALVIILAVAYWFRPIQEPHRSAPIATPASAKAPPPAARINPTAAAPSQQFEIQPTPAQEPDVATSREEKKGKPVLPYKMRNGLMVVQGDLVVGTPTREDAPDSGYVNMAPLQLWKKGNIPFHIQPSLSNPERIAQAVALFEGTAVHLTPYNGEEDAIVFEQGDKDCLSYVGKMGGKQPVWISPDCKPDDIAHEILHALGFVHEQNRSDRDNYIEMHFDNIDERYADNFEKLPQDFMKVSGLGEFD